MALLCYRNIKTVKRLEVFFFISLLCSFQKYVFFFYSRSFCIIFYYFYWIKLFIWLHSGIIFCIYFRLFEIHHFNHYYYCWYTNDYKLNIDDRVCIVFLVLVILCWESTLTVTNIFLIVCFKLFTSSRCNFFSSP